MKILSLNLFLIIYFSFFVGYSQVKLKFETKIKEYSKELTYIKLSKNVKVPKIIAKSSPRNQYIKPAIIPVTADVINFAKIYFFT